MLAQGYGKIINTASMATLLVPHPQKQIAYNASKAAVVKITQTLGTEWADRGLNVNCISPGIVNTALIQVPASSTIYKYAILFSDAMGAVSHTACKCHFSNLVIRSNNACRNLRTFSL